MAKIEISFPINGLQIGKLAYDGAVQEAVATLAATFTADPLTLARLTQIIHSNVPMDIAISSKQATMDFTGGKFEIQGKLQIAIDGGQKVETSHQALDNALNENKLSATLINQMATGETPCVTCYCESNCDKPANLKENEGGKPTCEGYQPDQKKLDKEEKAKKKAEKAAKKAGSGIPSTEE